MRQRLFFTFLGLVVILCLLSAVNPASSSADAPVTWSLAQRIRGLSDDSNTPVLVVDQNRTVHSFTSQWVGNDLAVSYSRWTVGGTWTAPIDILLSPNARQATVLGAFLDAKSNIHLIFYGGIEQGGEIYYSRAPAVNAGQATAWTPPKMIGPYAGRLMAGTLNGDERGNLYVLYSGNRDGNGLYEVHSRDGGDNWSEPQNVYMTDSANRWAFSVRATLDPQGQLHAVWTEKNQRGLGQTVYYARMDPGKYQWSFPITLQSAEGGDYQADWSSIVFFQNKLFVIYDYGSPPKRVMRQSQDGGKTWDAGIRPFPRITGEDGSPSFVVDGNNVLHVFLANRTVDNTLQGMWHAQWLGDKWSDLDTVVAGPLSPNFSPSRPQAVAVQGNTLLVTWRGDPGMVNVGIWYSFATLDMKELPVFLLPTAPPVATATPSATLRSQPTATPTPKPFVSSRPIASDTPVSDTSPTMGIVLGILPVVVLLLFIAIRRIR